jgi:endoglucanase
MRVLTRFTAACAIVLLAASCDSKSNVDPTTTVELPPRSEAPTNAFAGQALWVDSSAAPFIQMIEWRTTRPADATRLERIALQPLGPWFNEISNATSDYVRDLVDRATSAGRLPVFALYAIMKRDCGLYSAGGARSATEYLTWIDRVAAGIGARAAVVLLEPDAINEVECLSPSELAERLATIRDAVARLKRNPLTRVYIDAGNPGWEDADVIANRLHLAGIDAADGFMLNVSNFATTSSNVAYGREISALTGGVGFIIDTSRNGAGPAPDDEWCNPPGRVLGTNPTTNTGDPLVHAFLWVKTPGESDGTCNGGPESGEWWPEYALQMIERS